MRIGIVCPYSLDVPGGVQNQVEGSVRAFSDLGHEVMILAPGTHNDKRASLEIVGLGNSVGVHANGSVAPIVLSPRVVPKVAQQLRHFAPNVVVVHEPMVPMVSLGTMLFDHAPHFGIFHRAGSVAGLRFLRPLGGLVARRLTGGVVVSEEARRSAAAVVERVAETYLLAENAIDAARFSRATPTPTTRPTIVFLGRHEPRKGLEVLLRSIEMLPEELALWIIGHGPETERLSRRFTDARICWLGQLNDDEVAERLRGADVLVAPSLEGESFGVILLEAMAVGTAVVCSDLAGYRLAAGDAARYVPPGDPDALSSELRGLLVDASAREALVHRGSVRVTAYSFTRQIDQYLRLFGNAKGATENPEPFNA